MHVGMYVCACVHVYVCLCVCVHVYLRVYMCVSACVCMCAARSTAPSRPRPAPQRTVRHCAQELPKGAVSAPVSRAPGSRPFLPPRACVCLVLPNTEPSGDADGLRRLALWKVQSRYVQERNETAIHRLDLLRYVGAQLPFKSHATALLL
jgi:hypothetical protein